jgi:hypothetical protein
VGNEGEVGSLQNEATGEGKEGQSTTAGLRLTRGAVSNAACNSLILRFDPLTRKVPGTSVATGKSTRQYLSAFSKT